MKKDKTIVQDAQQEKKKGGYGLLSLMAMIIGIVIGSGIFAKNAGLFTSAGSTGMVALAWILGALIIITMVIAFLEIISVTEITGEQATISNWGRRLVGIRFGKITGIYFTLLYFPLIMAGLFQIGADSFLHTISYAVTADHSDAWYSSLTSNGVAFEGTLIAVSFGFLLVVMGINAISILPGKYFQNLGTAVKTIPLFLIIIVFITMIGSGDLNFATNDDYALIHDTNPLDGTGGAAFKALMATMPAVLFAFDGFLLAGSLSREAKKPTTFRMAFIFSMIFIVVIYLLYSLAILGLGDFSPEGQTHGGYGTISNAIYASFDADLAKIIDPLVTGIITISILTGVSGCSIASYRLMGDLSTQNIFKDKDGQILKKNKKGINTNGAFIMIGVTMVWFFIGSGFDSYLASTGHGALNIVGFSTDMIVVWAYFIYSIIIAAAMFNRITKKTIVHKRTLFWPAAIISTLCILVITVQFARMILLPGDAGTSDPIWQAKMIYTAAFFATLIIMYIGLGLGTGKATSLIEVSDSLAAKAEKGNSKAISAVELILKKEAYTAEYYGVTVDQLHAERKASHQAVEEERQRRKEAHDAKKNKTAGISNAEAKKLAKAEEAENKKKASKKPAVKQSKEEKAAAKKLEKELDNVDYSTKKVAPKSKK